jgi:glycosyltransferase involved in cell wall biosynthesis
MVEKSPMPIKINRFNAAMKIGFDAKRAFMNPTGLGVYSRLLIESMIHHQNENEYFLFTPDVKIRFDGTLKGAYSLQLPSTFLTKLMPALWRTKLICNDVKHLGLDVFHGLSNELPYGIENIRKLKKIVTIHDVLFMSQLAGDQYSFFEKKIYAQKVKHACNVADHIITASDATKEDLITLFNVAESKIKTIYQRSHDSFSKHFETSFFESIRKRYKLPSRFILNVSSFHSRKNHINLLKAFNSIQHKIEQDLVLVGGQEKERKKIEDYIQQKKLQSRVVILSSMPTDDLAALYQMADLFVYPSLAEGFGIPILEALSAGVTTVASDIDCFKEIGADVVYYTDTKNENTLAETMSFALKNPFLYNQLIARSKYFDKTNQISEIMKIYF